MASTTFSKPIDTELNDLATTVETLNTQIHSSIYTIQSRTFSSIAGNTDKIVELTLPTGWAQSDVACVFYLGYIPSSTWNTYLFPKNTGYVDNLWKFYFRTQGSTSQNYTVYFVFVKKYS